MIYIIVCFTPCYISPIIVICGSKEPRTAHAGRSRNMQIFKIDTDCNAAVKDIKGDLKSLQTEVGGLITLANYYEELEDHGIDIFADDEGLLKADPKTTLIITDKKNRMKVLTALVGNLIFVSHDDEGNTLGLTGSQVAFIKAHLKQLCCFTSSGKMNTVYTFWF